MPGKKYIHECKDEGQGPGPPFINAEYIPTCMHQPEEQRRFVRIEVAVYDRHEPMVALPHLPGNGYVPGFIIRYETAQPYRQYGEQNDKKNDEQVSPCILRFAEVGRDRGQA